MITLLRNLFHHEGLIEKMPKAIYPDPWAYSLGERKDYLTLHSWKAEEGFKEALLPFERRQVSASGRKAEVEFWREEFAESLKEGWYILQRIEEDGLSDNPREEVTTYVFYVG